jgi:DNA polymerase III epsilon subunit-like protein
MENMFYKETAFKMRVLALDFETNGVVSDDVLPCGAFPTQVSVTAYDPETDEITHLYDSYIRGARSLSAWALGNTHIRLELLKDAPLPEVVSAELAALWQEGDVVSSHNTKFDLDTVLPLIAPRDHPFLKGPRVCTMRQGWCPGLQKPRLIHVCREFEVPYELTYQHSAIQDSLSLAKCIQAAHKRGLPFQVLHRLEVSADQPDVQDVPVRASKRRPRAA